MMGDLSANFSRAEFACRCNCGFGLQDGDIDPRLVQGLQRMRELIGRPIVIISGCRCLVHNCHVGGVPRSQHLYGKAADLRGNPHVLQAIAEQVLQFHNGGIGYYPHRGFIHVDVRSRPARWTG